MNRKKFAVACRERNKKFLVANKHVMQYVLNKRRERVGVVLSFKNKDGDVLIGYSKCNIGLEKFDKHIGVAKAIYRAYHIGLIPDDVPRSMREAVMRMRKRAIRYFRLWRGT